MFNTPVLTIPSPPPYSNSLFHFLSITSLLALITILSAVILASPPLYIPKSAESIFILLLTTRFNLLLTGTVSEPTLIPV